MVHSSYNILGKTNKRSTVRAKQDQPSRIFKREERMQVFCHTMGDTDQEGSEGGGRGTGILRFKTDSTKSFHEILRLKF